MAAGAAGSGAEPSGASARSGRPQRGNPAGLGCVSSSACSPSPAGEGTGPRGSRDARAVRGWGCWQLVGVAPGCGPPLAPPVAPRGLWVPRRSGTSGEPREGPRGDPRPGLSPRGAGAFVPLVDPPRPWSPRGSDFTSKGQVLSPGEGLPSGWDAVGKDAQRAERLRSWVVIWE